MDARGQLPGAETVLEWFGRWPNFADAEIVSLSLARVGRSLLRVYVVDRDKPAVVEFTFEEITDLSLEDFSSQNVIAGFLAEHVSTDHFGGVVRVTLWPCFGLTGRIEAKRVRLGVIAGKPVDYE